MTTRMHAHDYIGQRKQSEWTIGSGNQIQFSGTCVASVLLLSCLANFFFLGSWDGIGGWRFMNVA